MEPNVAQQPAISNPTTVPQQPTQQVSPPPDQPQTPKSKIKYIVIALIVIMLIAIPIAVLGYFLITNNSDKNNSNTGQSQTLNNEIVIVQEESSFTVKDLSTNEDIIFGNSVEVACDPYFEERSTDDLITITVGPPEEEEGNFWVMWVLASDLKEGKQFNLPTGYFGDAEEMNGPTLFLLLDNDLNFSSEAEGSAGTITMHEYKGCAAGNTLSFSIDAKLVKVEGAEDQPTDGFAEVKGRFSSQVDQELLDDIYGTEEERKQL